MPQSHSTDRAGQSRENKDSAVVDTERQGAAASGSYAAVGSWPLSNGSTEHTSNYFQGPAEMMKEV